MKSLTANLRKLVEEYGVIAIIVSLTLFTLTYIGFLLALSFGVRVESVAGKAGLWGAAYLATELTKPIRILATLALTPVVAQAWRKLRPPPSSAPPPSAP